MLQSIGLSQETPCSDLICSHAAGLANHELRVLLPLHRRLLAWELTGLSPYPTLAMAQDLATLWQAVPRSDCPDPLPVVGGLWGRVEGGRLWKSSELPATAKTRLRHAPPSSTSRTQQEPHSATPTSDRKAGAPLVRATNGSFLRLKTGSTSEGTRCRTRNFLCGLGTMSPQKTVSELAFSNQLGATGQLLSSKLVLAWRTLPAGSESSHSLRHAGFAWLLWKALYRRCQIPRFRAHHQWKMQRMKGHKRKKRCLKFQSFPHPAQS